MGGQPRISGGGGGRQEGWGGVRAIPSPKRCSPRRLGLANSYSAVAGWACGTERPDMAADAPAAPVRGAAPTGAAGPLQLPRSRGAAGVGAGSTPPKIVRSPAGRGERPRPACDPRRLDPRPLPCTPFSCHKPLPPCTSTPTPTPTPTPHRDSWGSGLGSEPAWRGCCPRPGEASLRPSPTVCTFFSTSSSPPQWQTIGTPLHTALPSV